MSPPAGDEAERLRAVYNGYQLDAAARRRWNPQSHGNRAIIAERERQIYLMLSAQGYLPLTGQRVLDVGCGFGDVLAGFEQLGALPQNLYGVDLLPDRIAVGRQRHPAMNFDCVDAQQLPYPDGHFRLVLVFTVFSSILDETMTRRVASEIVRVLQPGGAVLWCDFRYDNPSNRHVRGIGRRRIERLFAGLEPRLQTSTVLPPLARRLGLAAPVVYPLLARIPVLRTHYLGLLVKPV